MIVENAQKLDGDPIGLKRYSLRTWESSCGQPGCASSGSRSSACFTTSSKVRPQALELSSAWGIFK